MHRPRAPKPPRMVAARARKLVTNKWDSYIESLGTFAQALFLQNYKAVA